MEIQLYPWQKEAYNAFCQENNRGILKVGTGKGKTIFAIYCIKKMLEINPDLRVCIIVPTITLMNQWHLELTKFLSTNISIGQFYGQKKEQNCQITIFVVNSAVKNNSLRDLHSKKPFTFLIADECHHYGAALFSKIFETKTDYILGLSATPERTQDSEGTKRIEEGIGPVIFKLLHIDDPLAMPKFSMSSILVDLTPEERLKYEENSFEIVKLQQMFSSRYQIYPEQREEFMKKIKELAEKKEPAALKLLSLWSKQADIKYQAKNKLDLVYELVQLEKDQKIIIFNERIDFVNQIYERLKKDASLSVNLIHSGKSKQYNLETLDNFKKSKSGILVVPRIIDEGYDVPDASIAIIAGFSSSARQMIQRDGRILRNSLPEKHAKRYTLIVRDLEENKYFYLIQDAGLNSFALAGQWLLYDNHELYDFPEFKYNYENYKKTKQKRKDEFEEWVTSRLDYYENQLKLNKIKEIELRLAFFERFLDVIDRLMAQKDAKWPKLSIKIRRMEKQETIEKTKSGNRLTSEQKEKLKEELRSINTRIHLPDGIFNLVCRIMDNEPAPVDDKMREYINTLTNGKKPDSWPNGIYDYLNNIVKPIINKQQKSHSDINKKTK